MTKRPVLILGARSDIGLAVAQRFAAEGYPIQLAARNPDTLEINRKDIEVRHAVAVSLHAYDALAFDRADAFLDGLPETPGVVVCVVGYLGDQAETEQDPAKAKLTVDSNFTGPTIVLERAARRLAELDEDTAIIGVSSVAGDRGRATNYWYGGAKAGFTAALSGLRQKYARSRLHVMTVKPGFVATQMTEHMDLPAALTASADEIAELTVNSWRKKRRVVVPLKWWVIMTIIKSIPEFVFERLKF